MCPDTDDILGPDIPPEYKLWYETLEDELRSETAGHVLKRVADALEGSAHSTDPEKKAGRRKVVEMIRRAIMELPDFDK
jgi:hypothetical protein